MSAASGPPASFTVAGLSLEGRRAANEDSACWAAYGPDSCVRAWAAVCDGMGGHNAGEVASAMALRALQEQVSALAGRDPAMALPSLAAEVEHWVLDINDAIREKGLKDSGHHGMGTTLALAVVVGETRLLVANVGDSKIFLVRSLTVQQLSVDHTALADQRRALGQDSLAPEDVAGHPFAHALTQSLGQDVSVAPAIRYDIDLLPGDIVVVTSDGVTDVLESERFLSAVESSRTLDEAAQTIYRLSFDGGSRDNISVGLIAFGTHERMGKRVGAPAAEEDPLDATRPFARPLIPVRPVSSGAVLADRGQPPAARRGADRKLVLAGAGVLVAVVALLAFLWSLFSPTGPAPVERSEAPPSPPARVAALATPTAVPPRPAPSVVPMSFPTPRPEPTSRPEREVRPERPRAEKGLPRFGSSPVPTPTVTPAPAPEPTRTPPPQRVVPLPTTPPPVFPTATPVPAEREDPEVSIGVTRLREVSVFVRPKAYEILLRFSQPVLDLDEDETQALARPRSILVTRPNGREKTLTDGDGKGGWQGYVLQAVRVRPGDRHVLAFQIMKSQTAFKGAEELRPGDRVELRWDKPPFLGQGRVAGTVR